MTIAKIIGQRLADSYRLRNVPAAVVEDVIDLALEEIAMHVSDEYLDPDTIAGEDFTACEDCANFGTEDVIAPVIGEGGEVTHLCPVCYDEVRGNVTDAPFDTARVEKAS